MTQTSAPWGGISTGDAALAPYDDQEWARIWRDMFRASKGDSGPLLGSGTSPDPGLTVQATGPASASVDVTAGSALVNGTWYSTDATVNLAIGANASGNPRIDTIVLQKDFTAQTIRLVVIPGIPAGTPVATALTQTAVIWEIPLADIAVANGFATITAANITPRTHWANAADGVYLFDVLNNSAALLQTGDVVVWDTTADRAVKTSTTLGDGNIAGVWVGRTAAGGYGRVLTRGIGYVNVTGAVATRGLTLVQSGTAKAAVAQAAADTTSKLNAIGISLQTTAGTGLCLAAINVTMHRRPAIVQVVVAKGADTGTTSSTFGDIDATNYKITIAPNSTRVKVRMAFSAGSNDTTAHLGEWDIIRVGGSRAGDATHGLGASTYPLGTGVTFSHVHVEIEGVFTGLTPGTSYEFRLQGRSTVNTKSVAVWGSLGEVFTAVAEEV